MKTFIAAVLILFILGALSLPLWANNWLQDRQASVQTATVLVLIAVTAYYAWHSKQQAEASRRMVGEMEQQRLNAIQPELVLCNTNSNVRNATVDFKEVLPLQDTIDLRGAVGVHNFGVGLARDIVSRVVVDGKATPEVPLPPLAPEFWTWLPLTPHWALLESWRGLEGLWGRREPERAKLELAYRDTFGGFHKTTVLLKHTDEQHGGYSYKVESIEYLHRHGGDGK